MVSESASRASISICRAAMAEMLLMSHDSLSRYNALSDFGEAVGLIGAAAASSCTLGSGGGGGDPKEPDSTTIPFSIPEVL